MKYRSTRGKSTGLSFEEAVFEGLATDGGLYIPHSIPELNPAEIQSWATLSYPEIATNIFRKFIAQDEIPDAHLADIVARSFATFSTPEVTPLEKLPNVTTEQNNPALDNLFVLELFHGPTFAFKDVALQVLGNLFEYFLQRKNQNRPADSEAYGITVLGATSGDTGGAAIYGLRGKKNVDVFILHPKGRISSVQEQQMTSVLDPNVHNIAVEGTFDDCQDIVKASFSDDPFRRRFHLAAVNSINWARILAQTSYYFYSYFAVQKRVGSFEKSGARVQYSVPTGNFGDVLAGYYAVRMGLPIDRFIIATNENDILHRFFQTGRYEKKKTPTGDEQVKMTLSPAMDILVSSNFERLVWYLVRGDGRSSGPTAATPDAEDAKARKASESIALWMNQLKEKGGFTVPDDVLARGKELFTSFCTSDKLTADAIHRYYHHQFTSYPSPHYVLDPHTAVGVVAAEQVILTGTPTTTPTYTICLSTASPGKFPDAVLDAINNVLPHQPQSNHPTGFKPVTYADIAPSQLVALAGLPKRVVEVSTDGGDKHVGLKKVQHVVEQTVGFKFSSSK
ncbi:hypothetical protein PhCBS80983_g02216 [Powellomyces hirtus]|uniref:threonine synthase n=1 Tax=Powellomyces hirtus TaxID=109895 RepID=A0A507E7F8_9FUNG|nr:hypothetical protein PhCBS80983_g02216 [Powellomyces hirtus]